MSGSRPQLLRSQTLWILLATILLSGILAVTTESFASSENLFRVSRYFAFIALVALGQSAVIATKGIDLSVGSVMGLSGIATGLALNSGSGLLTGIAAGLGVAAACGLVNGFLVAYVQLNPFVVTLGMLAIARSLAMVLSKNQMIYEFGPAEDSFFALGGGQLFGMSYPVWFLIAATLVMSLLWRQTAWGRHVQAIGGNEQAARAAGVNVRRTKLSVYLLSSLMAGFAAILTVSWLGSVTNALGQSSELRVIAAAVIGGADLMGGTANALGAVVGAALIEVIRNGLLLLGVDPYWQGFFVGSFIILAVLLERLRRRD